MQSLAAALNAAADSFGYTVQVTSGERTCEEQRRLNPRLKCSYHLSGDAIDIALLPTSFNVIQNTPQARAYVLRFLGAQAENAGYRWGGNFREPDPVHFDDGRSLG